VTESEQSHTMPDRRRCSVIDKRSLARSFPGAFDGELGGWRSRPPPRQPRLLVLSSATRRDLKTVMAVVTMFGVMFLIAVVCE